MTLPRRKNYIIKKNNINEKGHSEMKEVSIEEETLIKNISENKYFLALKKNLFSNFDTNQIVEFKIFSAPLKVEQNLIAFLLKIGITPSKPTSTLREKLFLDNVHKLADYYQEEILRLNNIAREYCKWIYKYGKTQSYIRPVYQIELQSKYNYIISRFSGVGLRLRDLVCQDILEFKKNFELDLVADHYVGIGHHSKLVALEEWYKSHIKYPYPSLNVVDDLAKQTNTSSEFVKRWFQTKREKDSKRRKINKEGTPLNIVPNPTQLIPPNLPINKYNPIPIQIPPKSINILPNKQVVNPNNIPLKNYPMKNPFPKVPLKQNDPQNSTVIKSPVNIQNPINPIKLIKQQTTPRPPLHYNIQKPPTPQTPHSFNPFFEDDVSMNRVLYTQNPLVGDSPVKGVDPNTPKVDPKQGNKRKFK